MVAQRRGPRAGDVDTRADIVTAALEEFSTHGYEGTAVRAVARRAGVDPALVRHYFGDKTALFAAALHLPLDPTQVIRGVLAGDPQDVGENVVRAFCQAWDQPQNRVALLAVFRTAMRGGATAHLLREFLLGPVLGQVARRGGARDPAAAAALAASQLAGVIVVRYVLEAEPVASAHVDTMVAWYGPVLQRHLTT